MKNDMDITILEDGTVRVQTGEVGGPEHLVAEKMLAWLAKELGGESTRVRRGHTHHHHHEHVHAGEKKA